MDAITVIIVVVVLALAVAAAAALYRRNRSTHLKERFGPEYARTVQATEDRRAAEKELHNREKRRSGFDLTPLPDASAARYRDEWASVQRQFVDQPAEAVEQADRLVVQMMRECGYPVDDFDQRADDISVDHPEVAQNYREAHGVAVAQSRGTADTEELRQAVTSYRRLVDVLLQEGRSRGPAQPEGPADKREHT
jgi:hypothetical protein